MYSQSASPWSSIYYSFVFPSVCSNLNWCLSLKAILVKLGTHIYFLLLDQTDISCSYHTRPILVIGQDIANLLRRAFLYIRYDIQLELNRANIA